MNQESRIKVKKNKIISIIHDSLFMIHSRGFTLIELLVVIAIIGILSSFLLANFIGVRQRARDGVRKSDLRQIQSALELYRSDQGGYPANSFTCGNSLIQTGFSSTIPLGSVIYMQKIPCDPTNTVPYVYTYTYDSVNKIYKLYSCLENVNDSQKDSPNNSTYGCSGTTNWSYTLQNP